MEKHPLRFQHSKQRADIENESEREREQVSSVFPYWEIDKYLQLLHLKSKSSDIKTLWCKGGKDFER